MIENVAQNKTFLNAVSLQGRGIKRC